MVKTTKNILFKIKKINIIDKKYEWSIILIVDINMM